MLFAIRAPQTTPMSFPAPAFGRRDGLGLRHRRRQRRVNTPAELVVPVIGANVLPKPVADQRHSGTGNRMPLASSTVTVRAVVDVPLAVTDPGLATRLEFAAEGDRRRRGSRRSDGEPLPPAERAIDVELRIHKECAARRPDIVYGVGDVGWREVEFLPASLGTPLTTNSPPAVVPGAFTSSNCM